MAKQEQPQQTPAQKALYESLTPERIRELKTAITNVAEFLGQAHEITSSEHYEGPLSSRTIATCLNFLTATVPPLLDVAELHRVRSKWESGDVDSTDAPPSEG